MVIEPIDIYSLFKNISTFIKKNKDVELDLRVFHTAFENTKETLKYKYKQLWNDLENGYFTYHELKMYLLHEYLKGNEINVMNIDKTKVKGVCNIFDLPQWEKDKTIILGICKNINKKNIKEFLEIKKEDEQYVAQELIKKGTISPIVYIKYLEKLELKEDKFKRIITKIKQELRKNKNANTRF